MRRLPRVADPPSPPVIPPKVRATLAKRLLSLARDWTDPSRNDGKDPLEGVQRALQGERITAFAERIAAHSEDLEREGQAEIATLVRCCQGLGEDAFSLEMLTYARDVHYIEKKHLTYKGLWDLFEEV